MRQRSERDHLGERFVAASTTLPHAQRSTARCLRIRTAVAEAWRKADAMKDGIIELRQKGASFRLIRELLATAKRCYERRQSCVLSQT
jgi:hypothetical protein